MPKPRRSTKRTTGLRTLLVLTLASAGLAVGTASATAATPCWKAVLSDWFADGRIDQTYPLSCYREAQRHLPPDAKAYSGAEDDIQRALLAAIRVDKEGGSGGGGSATGGGGGGSTPSSGGPLRSPSDPRGSGTSGESKHRGLVTRWFDAVGPANAESIPLPLLVLGGIAILLLLTAAASFIFRRLNARRPSAPPPEPEQL
jgi:hypothetical protein